jgi:Zn-finger nucleic acid-binding protein
MKRCPECDAPLFRGRFDGVELDGCKSCGGLFFDGGELGALSKARPEALREADLAFRPGMQPAISSTRTERCPTCPDAKLVSGEHPRFPGVAMRMCPTCKGVFLAHGAALALAERLAPEPRSELAASAATALAPSRARPAAAETDHTSTAGLPVVRGELVARDIPTGSGIGGAFERGVRFFRASLSLARECPVLLAPIYFGIALNLALLLALGLAIWAMLPATALADRTVLDAWLAEHYGGVLALSIGSGLVAHFVSYAAMGMTVSAVDAFLKGRPPRLGVAFRDVMKNLGGIAALAIVSMLVELLVGAIRGKRRGIFSNMLAGAIEAAWTVLSFLLLPVIMIEDVGLFVALDRVRAIHRNGVLTIAASEIGIRLVLGLAGFALFAIFAAILYLVAPSSTFGIITTIAVFGIAAVILNGFSTYLRASYYTCLYLWAAAVEHDPEAAHLRAPAPLASALE